MEVLLFAATDSKAITNKRNKRKEIIFALPSEMEWRENKITSMYLIEYKSILSNDYNGFTIKIKPNDHSSNKAVFYWHVTCYSRG